MQSEKTEMHHENATKLHVHDSSLDYKGGLPLRAATGSWRASYFIIAIEFGERLSYFGIALNLISYMTTVMHQDLATAVNSVNIWTGISTITPLLGGFLGDAYFGRFFVILVSAIIYFLGLSLFTMTQYIPSLKPCGHSNQSTCQSVNNVHKVVFYLAAYLMSVGTGGFKPCLEAFGADQFDDNDSKERKQKMSFFNWWSVSLTAGALLGVTVIVYTEDNVGWGVAFLVLTITMGLTVVVFLLGMPVFRYRTVRGSPLTPLLMVLVAAFAKRNLSCPPDSSLLYEVSKSEERLLCHTNRLRFLDKAAIYEDEEGETSETKRNSKWRLASVTRVEELKLVINMIPIWLTCLVFGVGIAQAPTFVVKQGSAMNRRVSNNSHFEIPPASLSALLFVAMLITVAIYDRIILPRIRRATGNERGISILTRIGFGMNFLVISMMVSALVERKRLLALQDGRVLSVFWLAPQAIILGVGDGFSMVGMQEYFYDQVPDSMRGLGMAFFLSVIGVGGFVSSLLIVIVNSVTGMNGGKKWIGKDVNHSRIDLFYWILSVIFVVNMGVFVALAKRYSYKNVQRNVGVGDSNEDDKGVELAGV